MFPDPALPPLPEGFDIAVVLSGGNALGAYHLGVCEELLAGGAAPSWYVGCSIGAITAAILVGNPPGVGIERLWEFWRGTSQADGPWQALVPQEARARWSNLYGLGALLGGRPGLSVPRVPGLWSILPFMPPDQAIQDLSPLRRTLERLIDFDRLNAAPERVSVVALDVETAEERWFDTREGGVAPEHLMACVSLLPVFPPVEVEGRLLCDAGFRDNLPVGRVFHEGTGRPTLCIASDLYGLGGAMPRSLDRAATRAQDLGFAAQGLRGIDALARERALLRRCEPATPPAILARLAYDAPTHQRALKALDFSTEALAERVGRGRADMAAMRHALAQAPRDAALAVVTRPGRAAALRDQEGAMAAS